VERKHGKRSRYVKLHFTVNAKTREVVAARAREDVKALPGLVDEVERNVRVVKVIGDGAYDSTEIYEMLEVMGIESVIKPRTNSGLNTPSPRALARNLENITRGSTAKVALCKMLVNL
jgi:hypothetical protein